MRSGRTRPKRGYQTAKQQVENTPQIATHEMAWFKEKNTRNRLRLAARYREKTRLGVQDPKTGDRSSVHTHPNARGRISIIDLSTALDHLDFKGLRTHHIVALDHGKVCGYLSYRLTKKMGQKSGVG